MRRIEHRWIDGVETKLCGKCKQWFPLSEFHSNRTRWDGLGYHCKRCMCEIQRKYYSRNKNAKRKYGRIYKRGHKEKIRAYMRVWYQEHRDEMRKYNHDWYCKHRDTQRESNRNWYQKHREERSQYRRRRYVENRAACLECSRRWRQEHKDERREYERKRYRENPDAKREYNRRWRSENSAKAAAMYRRRRARENNADGADYTTTEHIGARKELYGNLCYLCGAPAEAIDHVIPLSKGGSHWPANLRPICNRCNLIKHAKWPYDIEAHRRKYHKDYNKQNAE